jgi:hypothetical protein
MDYQEYKLQTTKTYHKGKSKVRDSYGVYDCYKHIRKNGWYDIGRPIKEHEFYTIIREVNKLLAEEIAQGNTVAFPCRMGKLELRKNEKGVSLIDGKLRITYPVNWEETIRLWYEDEEARKNKTLLRNEEKYVYHVKYCRHDANYENKSFYEFSLNRLIKQALKKNIEQKKIDTLW